MRQHQHRTGTFIAAAALGATAVSFGAAAANADEAQPGPSPTATAPAPPATPATPAPLTEEQRRARRAERARLLRRQLVRVALLKSRTASYVYGATGPRSFDCSGFTMWLYRTVAHRNLSHYSGAQMRQTRRVNPRHLLPGDLLFWGPGGSQHVSMYIGRGRMIGANNPSSGIRIESIRASWWQGKLAGAGRVIVV